MAPVPAQGKDGAAHCSEVIFPTSAASRASRADDTSRAPHRSSL